MTTKEEKEFNKLFKSIFKHGILIHNSELPIKSMCGDEHGSTMIIPTFKVVKELNKAMKKFKKLKKGK